MTDTMPRVRQLAFERLGKEIPDDQTMWEPNHDPKMHEFDSLDHVDFMMAVEEEFSIEISDEDARKLNSIAATAAYVERARAGD